MAATELHVGLKPATMHVGGSSLILDVEVPFSLVGAQTIQWGLFAWPQGEKRLGAPSATASLTKNMAGGQITPVPPEGDDPWLIRVLIESGDTEALDGVYGEEVAVVLADGARAYPLSAFRNLFKVIPPRLVLT